MTDRVNPDDRADFYAMVYNQPRSLSHAIVVLCGEDMAPRLETATALFMRMRAAPMILLSGGKDHAPRWMGAIRAKLDLLARGIAPGRILVEQTSQHTREQAIHIVALAAEMQWTHMTVVASHYHLPRAMLTLIKSVQDAGQADTLRLVPVAAPANWVDRVDGLDTTRLDLLDIEASKIVLYHDWGHCVSYCEGIEYLRAWEMKDSANAPQAAT